MKESFEIDVALKWLQTGEWEWVRLMTDRAGNIFDPNGESLATVGKEWTKTALIDAEERDYGGLPAVSMANCALAAMSLGRRGVHIRMGHLKWVVEKNGPVAEAPTDAILRGLRVLQSRRPVKRNPPLEWMLPEHKLPIGGRMVLVVGDTDSADSPTFCEMAHYDHTDGEWLDVYSQPLRSQGATVTQWTHMEGLLP